MTKLFMPKNAFRHFVFTFNNYGETALATFKDKIDPISTYYVVGKERGESGTPHLQGYVELSKQIRFSTLQKTLPGYHLERRKGTPAQAAEYCKKDGDFVESGELSRPGKRNDLLALYTAVKSGESDLQVLDAHPAAYLRHYKAVAHARSLLIQPKAFTPLTVTVIHGPTGVGKTRGVLDEHPDAYFLDNYPWFDGYVGQDVILLDDFYGGIPYSSLLRLLDGYRMKLAIKGGFTTKNWTKVFITSNKPPEGWYKMGLTPALQRRLTKVRDLLEEAELEEKSDS